MYAAELLRHRKINEKLADESSDKSKSSKSKSSDHPMDFQTLMNQSSDSSSYHLTRIVIVRFLAFIYGTLFLFLEK